MDAQQWRAEQQQGSSGDGAFAALQPSAGQPGRDPARSSDAFPLASVIVVCWNAADVLGRCLDHLLRPGLRQLRGHRRRRRLRRRHARRSQRQHALIGELRIVRSPRNRGCPHARNLGLRHAKGEIVAFIDADGFAAPSWLRQIVDAFAARRDDRRQWPRPCSSTRIPLVINGAGGIVNRQGWAADLSMNESYERAQIASEALYPMGCGMALRRSARRARGAVRRPHAQLLRRRRLRHPAVARGLPGRRGGRAPGSITALSQGGGDSLREAAALRAPPDARGAQACLARACSRAGRYTRHASQDGASPARRALKLQGDRMERALACRACSQGALASAASGFGTPGTARLTPPGETASRRAFHRCLTPRPAAARATASTWRTPASEGQLIYGWFPRRARRRAQLPLGGCAGGGTGPAARRPQGGCDSTMPMCPSTSAALSFSIRRLDSSNPLSPVWATTLWPGSTSRGRSRITRSPFRPAITKSSSAPARDG